MNKEPSILAALYKLCDDALAEEGLTKDIIDYVDLDIECSPVICFRGESPRDAVTVNESTDPNRYLLRHPMIPSGWVTKDELKIMRARYLLATRGRPDPTPIAIFRTDTPEGMKSAREFLTALGMTPQEHEPNP